jgi:hypothetical protein
MNWLAMKTGFKWIIVANCVFIINVLGGIWLPDLHSESERCSTQIKAFLLVQKLKSTLYRALQGAEIEEKKSFQSAPSYS